MLSPDKSRSVASSRRLVGIILTNVKGTTAPIASAGNSQGTPPPTTETATPDRKLISAKGACNRVARL